jgi:hypothetical protein
MRYNLLWRNGRASLRGVGLAMLGALCMAAPASAQGLQKARSVLEILQDELTTIVPVIAAITLLCLGVAYAARFIEKDTFARWAIGVIIAGSAVQITSMLFT